MVLVGDFLLCESTGATLHPALVGVAWRSCRANKENLAKFASFFILSILKCPVSVSGNECMLHQRQVTACHFSGERLSNPGNVSANRKSGIALAVFKSFGKFKRFWCQAGG
jgi:hypothetical protein